MEKIRIQVPATSANCGPGYDTLGVACTLYNELSFELLPLSAGLVLEASGEGKEYLVASENNLVFKSFFSVWRAAQLSEVGLKISMQNNIPMSRGLGSSSSAIVAGVYAANVLGGKRFSQDELLNFATAIEGHPDNVAPALLGGFTISYMEGSKAHSLSFKPVLPLKLIAAVPEHKLATSLARKAIPQEIKHTDAVFNVARASLLVAALMSGSGKHLAAALEDRLHQPYRAHLIPGLHDVFAAAKEAGAYNAIISGAGSTVMAYAADDADHAKIAVAMQHAFEAHGQKCQTHILDIDYHGVCQL